MRRLTTVGLILFALLVVSAGALAAPSSEQLQELDAIRGKMVELRKEMIGLQLEAGTITDDQADRMIDRIDAWQEKALAPQQKQVLNDLHKKQVELRKKMVEAETEAGLLTKEQAKRLLARIEAGAAYRERMGIAARPQLGVRARRVLGQQGRVGLGLMRNRMGVPDRGQRANLQHGRGFRGPLFPRGIMSGPR